MYATIDDTHISSCLKRELVCMAKVCGTWAFEYRVVTGKYWAVATEKFKITCTVFCVHEYFARIFA